MHEGRGNEAMRQHLGECSGGKIRHLMCGHCELRTSWWPLLCDHLNQPGMETKAACRPEFRMSRTVPRLFSSHLPSLSSSTLRDVSVRGKRYRTHESLSPEQLVSFRGEAARLRQSSDKLVVDGSLHRARPWVALDAGGESDYDCRRQPDRGD